MSSSIRIDFKPKHIILTVLVFFLGLGAVIYSVNPLFWSEDKIREKLLESTPIGSQMEDVIKKIEGNKKWKVDEISYEHGFYHKGITPSQTIGNKSIRVEMGEYRLIFVTSVTVFWGFDKDSRLVDIWVWKTVDAL